MSGIIEIYNEPTIDPVLKSVVYIAKWTPIFYDAIMQSIVSGDCSIVSRWFPGKRKDVLFIDGATVDERKYFHASYAQKYGLNRSLERIIDNPETWMLTFRIDNVDKVNEWMNFGVDDVEPQEAREYLERILPAI